MRLLAIGGALLALILTGVCHAGDHPRLRRFTLVAACTASLVGDSMSTQYAISRGAHEANPMLSNDRGGMRWGLALGIKGAWCAGSALAQEHYHGHDVGFSVGNSILAGFYTGLTIHNIAVAKESK